MAHLFTNPKFQAFDNSGSPLVGGKLYTYAVGTTTNKATYPTHADALAATNANDNPIVLDGRGEAAVYGLGTFKFVLKDSDGTTLWTFDNVILGNEGDVSTAGSVVYLSDFDDIAAAVTAISSTEVTLVINEDDTMDENVTVPSTTTLKFWKGNTITTTGYTLTVYEPASISALPSQQIFSGSGTVAFTKGGTIYPGWMGFGESATAAENATAMNWALSASPDGGDVRVPAGQYTCDTFSFGKDYTALFLHGVELIPDTSEATQIVIDNVSDCKIEGGYLNGEVSTANIKIAATSEAVRRITLENIRIKGGASSGSGTDGDGILVDASDGNNIANVICKRIYATHVNNGVYLKCPTTGGGGIDSSVFDVVHTWPYGTATVAGHGIKVEAAINSNFKRIYAGLFEHNTAAGVYVKPQYSGGVNNCTFQDVNIDVTDQNDCRALWALPNDANKPFVGNTIKNIKAYVSGASGAITGLNAVRLAPTATGTANNNEISGLYSNNVATDEMLVLGSLSSRNTIIMTGYPMTDSDDWVQDSGVANTFIGNKSDPVYFADNTSNSTSSDSEGSIVVAIIEGNSLETKGGVRFMVNARLTGGNGNAVIRVKFGSTYLDGGSGYTVTDGNRCHIEGEIYNDGANNSQRYYIRVWDDTTMTHSGSATTAEDTSADCNLDVRGSVTAGDTLFVEHYNVEFYSQPIPRG